MVDRTPDSGEAEADFIDDPEAVLKCLEKLANDLEPSSASCMHEGLLSPFTKTCSHNPCAGAAFDEGGVGWRDGTGV